MTAKKIVLLKDFDFAEILDQTETTSMISSLRLKNNINNKTIKKIQQEIEQ